MRTRFTAGSLGPPSQVGAPRLGAMFGRLLAAAVTFVVAGVLLLACWPQLLGAERLLGVAQLVSLRGLAVLATVLAGALVLIIAAITTVGRRFFASVGVLLLAFAVVSVGVLAVRGADPTAIDRDREGGLIVLTWNTLGDAPGEERIAQLALDRGADVVALPETSRGTAVAIARILGDAGRPMQVLGVAYDEHLKARSTMVLVSETLGDYEVDDSVGNTPTLPSVVAVPVDGSGPTIIAAHPVAPVPAEMENWRVGLDWLAERCADPASDVIVAGDLNSTIDHWAGLGSDVGLAGCRDSARAVGGAAIGTWPTRLPALLGSPIDHVLATDAWTTVGFEVIEVGDTSASDHRPVVAQLVPAGG